MEAINRVETIDGRRKWVIVLAIVGDCQIIGIDYIL